MSFDYIDLNDIANYVDITHVGNIESFVWLGLVASKHLFTYIIFNIMFYFSYMLRDLNGYFIFYIAIDDKTKYKIRF